MLHGVTINGTNTLTAYGLFLCADLNIGEPTLKENLVDIPGGNGALNMSYSPQGYPVYNNREISFTLAKRMTDADRATALAAIRNLWHGREVSLVLPDDANHYWHGIISFGGVSGYNSGKIPVKMTAEPYKLKNAEATVTSGAGTVTLTNEGMPVVPTVTSTGSATIAWDGHSVAISAGEQTIPQLVLPAGETEITITGSATVTFTWREGSL